MLRSRLSSGNVWPSAQPEVRDRINLIEGVPCLTDLRSQELPVERLHAMTLFSSPFAHPTVMFNMSHLDAADLRYSGSATHAEDYDLWERARSRTVFANIPEFLLCYRRHPGQVSAALRLCRRSEHGSARQAERRQDMAPQARNDGEAARRAGNRHRMRPSRQTTEKTHQEKSDILASQGHGQNWPVPVIAASGHEVARPQRPWPSPAARRR